MSHVLTLGQTPYLSNTLSVLRPTPAPGRGAGGRNSKWHLDT